MNLENIPYNTKLAITGQNWGILREKYPNFVSSLLKKVSVFARMTSDQKQQVIVELQLMGLCVGV